MFRLVLCIVFIILRAEANVPETVSENPEIRLSYNHDGNEDYTVWKDKPLTIVIENAYAQYVWCFNHYFNGDSRKFVPETELSNDTIIKLNIANVTSEMSTTWACLVLQEYKLANSRYRYKNHIYSAKTLSFNLHVKGAGAVILIAFDSAMTYVTTNLSVNYDGEANYTYEAGEDFLMEFSCQKARDNHKEDTLRLEYYNAEGILLFQTKRRVIAPHMFRSVLKSNNDKYYLDCIRTARPRSPEREYRYRTTFIKRDLHADAVQQAVILSVNGQKLTTSFSNDNNNYYYTFKYIDGEVLKVTCRKMNVFTKGTLSFYSDAQIMSPTLRSQSGAVISVNMTPFDIKNKSLTCSINNSDMENQPTARLLLLSDVPYNNIRIRGLPRNNILYQYTNDVDQLTIEYQYSVNDILNLTCVSNEQFNILKPHQRFDPFQWIFQDKRFDSPAIWTRISTTIKFSEIPFTQMLDTTHNGTTIKCIYFRTQKLFPTSVKIVEIILRLKPELVSKTIVSGAKSTNSYTLIYCLTAAGVSVIIILIILYWTVKNSCCGLRSRSQELSSVPAPRPHPFTPYYENLLAVFQPINEQEAVEMENHYEEIQ